MTYAVSSLDGGRRIPAGSQDVQARLVDEGGAPLPLVAESCSSALTSERGGVDPVHEDIDWGAASSAQLAAIRAGLRLSTDPVVEFGRVLYDECGFDSSLDPPRDVVGHTILELDNGAPVTVGVIGDSVTSQIRDELVADTRFNWVVASLCGARIDTFLGLSPEPSLDLSFALDAVLAAQPDAVVVATGSVDARDPSGGSSAYIETIIGRLASVRCPAWMNAYLGTANPDWSNGARRFNARLDTAARRHGVVQLDWHSALTASEDGTYHPWLLAGPYDQLHVSVPTGHQARVGMTLAGLEACTAPPPPITCVSGVWDVWADHDFCDEISWLLRSGITTGYADFTFRPGSVVTRRAMAAFLYRLSGSPPFTPPDPPTFADVAAAEPFAAEIEWLVSAGVTGGYADGTFRPDGSVTRQAMATFLYRLAGEPRGPAPRCSSRPFADVAVAHPFCGEIDWLADSGISTGYPGGTFRPTSTVTRQAMAAFLQRFALLG